MYQVQHPAHDLTGADASCRLFELRVQNTGGSFTAT